MPTLRTLTAITLMAVLPGQVFADNPPASAATQMASPAATGEHHGFDHYWSKLDPNGKGYVTKEQWMANAEKRFHLIDANNDGKVTKDELKAYDEKMREKFRQHREHHVAAPESTDSGAQ